MLKPTEALTKDLTISTYSLVVGIAKKARAISAEAQLRGEVLPDKPVDLAVDEYIEHDFIIKETEPCAVCGRLDCICEQGQTTQEEEAMADAIIDDGLLEQGEQLL